MDSCEAARDWLCTPASQVSAHYLISPGGEVMALVPEEARAWHAGASAWGAVCDVNSRSIGIELSNTGQTPFSAQLMMALDDLLRTIMDRWAIPPARVIGHSDCAPDRKIDPGPRFDWARLARQGLAVAAGPVSPVPAPDPARFLADLGRIGYRADLPAETLLSAFRLRHRQGQSGPLDGLDCALAADLATQGRMAALPFGVKRKVRTPSGHGAG